MPKKRKSPQPPSQRFEERVANDPELRAALERARERICAFGLAVQMAKAGEAEYRQRWAERSGEPYPDTLDDLMRLAADAGFDLARLHDGDWVPGKMEILVEGYLRRRQRDKAAATDGDRPEKLGDDRGKRPDASPEIWNSLTERQRNCLQALYESKAFDADSCLRASEIAVKVDGRGAGSESFKKPLSDLAMRELVASKTGRGGGSWLTAEGQELVRSRIS